MQQFVQKLKALNWRFVIKGVLAILMLIPVLIVIGMTPVVNRPLYNWILSILQNIRPAVNGVKKRVASRQKTSTSNLITATSCMDCCTNCQAQKELR